MYHAIGEIGTRPKGTVTTSEQATRPRETAASLRSKPLATALSFPRLQLAPDTVIHCAELLLVGIVFLLLADRFFTTISEYAVNIFFSDQWDFNDATLFQHHSLWQMFSWQHGPHRQGVGALLELLAEPLFRWNSRTESFFVGGIILIAALCALWLKKRLYGRLSYSDVIIPLVFLSPLQYETLFVTANFAHGPLPLLLIVLYCLAWTCRHLLLRYGLVLTINFLTIYTGFGLFLGLLTPLLLAIDYWVNLRDAERGRIYFVLALLLSLASFGSFFIGYTLQPAADCFSFHLSSLTDYAWYVALMFSLSFDARGTNALPTVVGLVVVCALLASLALSARGLLRARSGQWTRHATIAIMTTFCLLFCLSTAYGRLCLGIEHAQSSRYVIYLNLGLLGLYFALLGISNTIARNALVVILGVSLLGTIEPGKQMRREMAGWPNVKQQWKNCYLAIGDMRECNRYAQIYPEPENTHLQEKLDFLKRTRQNLFADSK